MWIRRLNIPAKRRANVGMAPRRTGICMYRVAALISKAIVKSCFLNRRTFKAEQR
jgi:hypothetical protein